MVLAIPKFPHFHWRENQRPDEYGIETVAQVVLSWSCLEEAVKIRDRMNTGLKHKSRVYLTPIRIRYL